MASFSKTKIRLQLRDHDAIMINIPRGHSVTKAKWTLLDIAGNPIFPPNFSEKKAFNGLRVEADEDGIYFRSGEAPNYVKVQVKCEVTTKNAKGVPQPAQKLSGEVSFYDSWGTGVAKSIYPFPANYDLDWRKENGGKRALVLLYELIGLLPEEYRKAAGGMPIVLTDNYKNFDGKEWNGAHVPLYDDAIKIRADFVRNLSNSPTVTVADAAFIRLVIHEMSHAVTYRKCLWGVHHGLADARKTNRDLYPGLLTPAGWLLSGLDFTGSALIALAQNIVWPEDIVSDFSAISGWELTSPLAFITKVAQPIKTIADIGNFFLRLPSQGLGQDTTVRPNLVTGVKAMGTAFGLRHRADASARQTYLDLKKERENADYQLANGPAAEKTKWAKEAKRLKKAETDAYNAWGQARSDSGLVSHYAAEDVLEDIAETLTFYLLSEPDLKKNGSYFGDRKSKTLRAKRKFFADQYYLPPKDTPPVRIGSLMRGYDAADHLNLWEVEI